MTKPDRLAARVRKVLLDHQRLIAGLDCDHDVGICGCEDKRETQQLLTDLEAWKP